MVSLESGAAEVAPPPPLPAAALGLLFERLDYSVPRPGLERACALEAERQPPVPPQEQLRRILAALQRSDVSGAMLRWDRFDLRRLPALVLMPEGWHVATREGDGPVKLEDGSGAVREAPADALAACPVLWVRVRAKPQTEGLVAEVRSPAARLLISELLREPRWLAEVIVATVLVNALAVASSIYSMQVYDRVIPSFSWVTLWALTAGMVIVMVLDWLLKYSRARILDRTASRVDLAVSQRLYEHLLALRLDTRPRGVGTLAAQMQGLESVRSFLSSSIVFALSDMPFAIIFIGLIAVVGGPVAWVYLGLLPFALVVGWIAKERLATLTRMELQRSHERHGMLVDSIQGAETIQSTGSAWRFADQWAGITSAISGYSLKSRLISSTAMTTVGTLSSVAYVLGIVAGVMAIESSGLTMGALIACSILGGRVIAPVSQASQLLVQWQHVKEALGMANRLLALEAHRRDGQDLLAPAAPETRVSLEGVRFSYAEAPVVRLTVDKLSIGPGSRVVLLGGVGSGKSTLLKVMAGLFKPSEGRVRLGDADLWELDPALVGQELGYLPQDVHLFRGTLRYNVGLSGLASDDRFLETVKRLGLDAVAADNPRGLDLEIGEGGSGLSGGQRQLACLARLLLAKPRIWLLDEPTASLDADTENRVIETIAQTVGPQDVLIIATHRPRLLSLCNRVLVMQQGRIVADGPPAEILAAAQPKASHG